VKRAARLPGRHPSAAEWRMLRALAHAAIAEAVSGRPTRVSFHGYCIEARITSWAGDRQAFVDLALGGIGSDESLDRVRIAIADRNALQSAWRIHSLYALARVACQSSFLAGCVSPVDARHASPETGHIS
jgi:hypothetical protein